MQKPLTVVGIPARNEARTIGKVAEMADRGLRDAFPHENHALILAENGSTDDTVGAFHTATVESFREVVGTRAEAGEIGKGANMLAIIGRALEWDAERVVFLDADVRSVESRWVGELAEAVNHGDAPAMAVPRYRRNRFEANTTNHLASPLLAATLGRHVEQPIGGEFALNRACMERIQHWSRPESALLYGIDVWLTTNAIREHMRLVDVELGRKIHTPPFAKVLRMPQQVLDSLFHVITTIDAPRPLQTVTTNSQHGVDDDAGSPPEPELVTQVTQEIARYLDAHRESITELFPSTRQIAPADWGMRITTDHWPHVLADALTALAAGHFQAARDHLIACYVQRIYTWWTEIADLDSTQTQDLVTQQVHQTASVVQGRRLKWSDLNPSRAFHRGYWEGYEVTTGKAALSDLSGGPQSISPGKVPTEG